jgi:hypothetical protein
MRQRRTCGTTAGPTWKAAAQCRRRLAHPLQRSSTPSASPTDEGRAALTEEQESHEQRPAEIVAELQLSGAETCHSPALSLKRRFTRYEAPERRTH